MSRLASRRPEKQRYSSGGGDGKWLFLQNIEREAAIVKEDLIIKQRFGIWHFMEAVHCWERYQGVNGIEL